MRWPSVLVALAVTGSPVLADPPTVSFEQAVGAGQQLPELVGRREAADQTARAQIPRPWSPLVLTLTPSYRFEPVRSAEGGVAVQQYVPLADLAGARREQRDALAARRRAELAARALEARLAAASAWIDCWAARARLANAERDLELARSLADVTARGVTAGAYTAPELADARAFVAEATARRIDAEGDVADAAFQLAIATSRTGRVLAEGDLPAPVLAPPDAWPRLAARARQLPEVAAHRLAARADRARAVEERRTRGTQLVLGAELLRDEPDALVGSVTLGLALPHDRGQREAQLALADAREADARAETAARRGVVELERALHDVAHTGELLASLERDALPAADEAAARRRRAYELGESTIVELLAAQRTALAVRARATDARAAHAWARVRAWLLVQEVTP